MGMVDSLWGRDLIPAETYHEWARVCMQDGDPDAYYSKVCRNRCRCHVYGTESWGETGA